MCTGNASPWRRKETRSKPFLQSPLSGTGRRTSLCVFVSHICLMKKAENFPNMDHKPPSFIWNINLWRFNSRSQSRSGSEENQMRNVTRIYVDLWWEPENLRVHSSPHRKTPGGGHQFPTSLQGKGLDEFHWISVLLHCIKSHWTESKQF